MYGAIRVKMQVMWSLQPSIMSLVRQPVNYLVVLDG